MFLKFLLGIIFNLLLITSQVFAHSTEEGPFDNIGGFVEGTLVHTSTGPDTIQNIRVNDRLFSFSTETGKIVESRVTKVHRFPVDQIVKLVISGEKLYLNPDHKFYLPDSGEWIAAKDLDIDTVLLNKKGENLLVEDIEFIQGREWLYDISVEDTENYFVGKNEILVHNFVFVIPVVTWVIGQGLVWITAATIIATVVTVVVATEISKRSSNKQGGTVEVRGSETGRYDPNCDRSSNCPSTGSSYSREKPGPYFKTNAEAAKKAEELGFQKINERVHGQSVFRRGNDYITRDTDGHINGAWKMAKNVKDLAKKETRSGTYDANLNKIGD